MYIHIYIYAKKLKLTEPDTLDCEARVGFVLNGHAAQVLDGQQHHGFGCRHIQAFEGMRC